MSLPKDKSLENCKDLRNLQVVKIDWVDARSSGGWLNLSEYRKFKPLTVRTVGFLIANNKDFVQVVQSLSELGSMADSVSVPRGWIKSFRTIWKQPKK